MKLHPCELVGGLDKPISALALGTAWYEPSRQEEHFELLDAFVACGGTLIDTARHYGSGNSETVVGAWLASRGARGRVVVLTKGGHGTGVLPDDDLEDSLAAEIHQSLGTLQTEHIDLYLLHRDNPAVPVGRAIDCLNAHVAAGRLGRLGASNWTYDRIADANAYAEEHGLAGFALVSNHLSLARPARAFYPGLVSTDADGLAWHRRTGIGLLPWSSGARGFFTDRFDPDAAGGADLDEYDKQVLAVCGTEENFERRRRAQELGQSKGGYSAVQIALAWVLHQPLPIVPVIGPRTPAEVRSCVEAAAIRLTDDERDWLDLGP